MAIENIQQSGNLTIIMIAHRLQTIATAQNLLYINNPKEILPAEKGTAEYDRIFQKLKTENYKHQQGESIDQFDTANRLRELEKQIEDDADFGTIDDIPSERLKKTQFNFTGNTVSPNVKENTKGDDGNWQMVDLPPVDKVTEQEVKNIQKSIDEIKKSSLVVSGNIYEGDDDEGYVEDELAVESDAGFIRVMKYYNPKIFALLSMFTSIAGSFAFPLFGYIFSELMFIIMIGRQNPNYIEDRNFWCLNFLYMALGMGIVGCL